MRVMPFPRLLQHFLVNTAAARADHEALVIEGTVYTYGALLDAALRLASSLAASGIGRGDRVVIYAENGWTTCVAVYATLFVGGVLVIVNPQTKPEKLGYIVDDCAARGFVTEGHLLRNFGPVLAERAALPCVVCAGKQPDLEGGPRILPFDAALGGAPWEDEARSIPTDLAAIIYTSGTTGRPKGVMLTQQSMVFTAQSICEYLEYSGDLRTLSVLPMSFSYGLYQLLQSVCVGSTLVLERSFAYPARILERLVEQRVSVFPGVPSMYAYFIASHARTPLTFPAVRVITHAAAPLPDAHALKLAEIFPNAKLYKMYGQTECARGCFLDPALVAAKPGSVGKAIPGTELLVLDAEGRPVRPGEHGILHIRGPHVMAGYFNLPEETAQALVPGPVPGERMLRTGDWFKVDDAGYHYFVGRSDDIIKTRGEKVSPVEVETMLHAIPGVKEATVIGVPDPVHGQAVRAHVVLEEGHVLTAKQVQTACAAALENYMVPRDVLFETELPKSPNGKILKRELVARAEAEATAT